MRCKPKYLPLLLLPILLLAHGSAFSESARNLVATVKQRIESNEASGPKDFEPLLVLLRSDISDDEAATLLDGIRQIGSPDGDSTAEFKQYAYKHAPQVLLDVVRSKRRAGVRKDAMFGLRSLNAPDAILQQAIASLESDQGPDQKTLRNAADLLRGWLESPRDFVTKPDELRPKTPEIEQAAIAFLKARKVHVSLSALNQAARKGEAADVLALLDAGFDVNASSGGSGIPVAAAVQGCASDDKQNEAQQARRMKTIDALISRGANLRHADARNNLLLHDVAHYCNSAIAARLIGAGAPYAEKNMQDYSPLDIALVSANWEVAKTLVASGARTSKQRIGEIFFEPPSDPDIAGLLRQATETSRKKIGK